MDLQLLSGLNVAQKAAVTSQASVLQVLAPPGSGKTKTLTSRVAYLIAHDGYDPRNVICCTFTVKASREMRERLRLLIGRELESKLVMGTFHSICRQYLVAYGSLIGLPKGFGIADKTDSDNIVKRVIKRLNLSLDPKSTRSKISRHKATGKTWEAVAGTATKKADHQDFVTAFQEYEKDLATSHLLDYDDLLLRCVDLLRLHPECVSNIEALLIDEFQDTNVVQFDLMKLLATAKRRITIVGDPDQSIYGFRSAEIENLQRMKKFYPEALVINLEENYRSASAILMLAQDVIEQDTSRPQKKLKATHCYGTKPVLRRLPNPNEEALWIASEIKRTIVMTGGLLEHSDIAILIRSAYLSLLIEKALAGSGIPYRMIGGHRFFDRVEIRILVDYLRTISHPDNNQAFLAIINTPSRKIGETTIAELVKVGEERSLSLWSVVQKLVSGSISLKKNLSKPAEQELGRLIGLLKSSRKKMVSSLPADVPGLLIGHLVECLDFENYLAKKYKEDHKERFENVKELITHASDVLVFASTEDQLMTLDGLEQETTNAGEEVLAQFLANIVLSTDAEKDEGIDKPRVTISTIHSAKGLEWPVVFLPALYEGSIPHSRSEDTDEERRLFYVAITRAQALLTMSFPLVQSRDQTESSLSQFLPPTLNRRLAQIGPLFDNKIITDIATILRRPVPSQEDLSRSLESIGLQDSTTDDLWPVDGSRRPMSMSFSGSTSVPHFGLSLGEVLGAGQDHRQADFAQYNESRNSATVQTTMVDVNSLSVSNTTLGFTTARHQLHVVSSEVTSSASDVLPPKKKPKLTQAPSGQGDIATFFMKKAQVTEQTTQPCSFPSKTPHRLVQEQKPTLPPMIHQPTPVPLSTIPEQFSSHKLHFRNSMIKRPAPLKEISSNKRTRHYGGIYSSSPPPPDLEEQGDVPESTTLTEKPQNKTKDHEFPGTLSISATTPLKNYVLSRPATTMHTTTMSSISQSGHLSATSRKTLGIRRTMNGWENRKHK